MEWLLLIEQPPGCVGAQGPPAMDSTNSPTERHCCLHHTLIHGEEPEARGPLIRYSAPWEVAETEVHVSNATSKPWWTPSRLFALPPLHNLGNSGNRHAALRSFFTPPAMDLFCCTYVSSSSGLS